MGWSAKVESQEIPRKTGRFGLREQNEAGTGQQSFVKGTHQSQQTPPFNRRDDSIHGHHQKANTEIRLIICFAAEDGAALYSQQKQVWELMWLRLLAPYCKIQT